MTNGSQTEAIRLVSLAERACVRYEQRRLKAAISVAMLWSCIAALHLLAWGQWVVYGLTILTGIHFLRLLLASPEAIPAPLPSWQSSQLNNRCATAEKATNDDHWPYVSILVAAKNEVAVIRQLTQALMSLDYPSARYDVWLINDNSTDGTAEVLNDLSTQFSNLRVVHRDRSATGGKSGALNQVWPKTRGSLLVVFDADAQISTDCLRRILPMFEQPSVGAVQMRKAIANAAQNFWTRSQVAEMAFDAYCQIKRASSGGIGELRGNGQVVRRSALEQCGGWNEETITDDLDLTFKLHLTGWDISLVLFPPVYEEGVVNAVSLWHQRNRWAEGGYQRYLDYWRLLVFPTRLGWSKALDLLVFWIVQYALPSAAIPDVALALVRHRPPVLIPLSSLVMLFSSVGMANGLWLSQKRSRLTVALQTLRGMFYMTHWFVVISTVTLRMSLRPKRLRWIKTQHTGGDAVIEATLSSH